MAASTRLARPGAVAGEHQLLGEERVAFGAAVDLVDERGGRAGAQQVGEVLGQFGAGEAGQVQGAEVAPG